jgi:hypothetical protein
MKRSLVIGGAALLLVAVFSALVPLGMVSFGMRLSGHGYAAVFLTIFFSSAVAGGLMFLIFYSARQGFDDAAHESMRKGPHDDPNMH